MQLPIYILTPKTTREWMTFGAKLENSSKLDLPILKTHSWKLYASRGLIIYYHFPSRFFHLSHVCFTKIEQTRAWWLNKRFVPTKSLCICCCQNVIKRDFFSPECFGDFAWIWHFSSFLRLKCDIIFLLQQSQFFCVSWSGFFPLPEKKKKIIG